MSYCRHCGGANDDEAAFCTSCGSNIATNPPSDGTSDGEAMVRRVADRLRRERMLQNLPAFS